MFGIKDYKAVANYVSVVDAHATALHYYFTEEEGNHHRNDYYNYMWDMIEAIEDVVKGVKTFEEAQLDAFGFSDKDKLTDAVAERLREYNAIVKDMEGIDDFIFINRAATCKDKDGSVSPDAISLCILEESDKTVEIYKLKYMSGIHIKPVTAKRVRLIDIRTNKDMDIIATNTPVIGERTLTSKAFNKGTAFASHYAHTCLEGIKTAIKELKVKECRSCHCAFAQSPVDLAWFADKGLKEPNVCMDCRKHKKN